MVESAKVFVIISTFSVVLPFLLIVSNRSNLKKRYLKLLTLLMMVSFVADAASLLLSAAGIHSSIAYFLNIQDIAQFVLFVLIYREFYLDEHKKTLFFAALIYFGFEIISTLFFQSLNVNQTWSWTFSALILSCLSIGYFNYLLKTDPVYIITKFGPFWINVAVLLYFGFSLYLFAMAEFVFTKMETNSAIIFWSFHNLNNILKNIIFAVGIHRMRAK